MEKEKNLALFEKLKMRKHYDQEQENWYFSTVDLIQILTESKAPKKYWSNLKKKLRLNNHPLYEKIVPLKFEAENGRKYPADCLSMQDLLRLIQLIPSPKAEPFKLWLAKVGYERMQEMRDPGQSIHRAIDHWRAMGHSDKWIQQRIAGQQTRSRLTDYWHDSGVKKSAEFALLTKLIHQEWADITIQEHKARKGLKNENLRDHMTEAELIFTALAELSAREIAEKEGATGFKENRSASKKGGKVAKKARLALEKQTGKQVISSENFLPSGEEEEEKKLE